MKRAKKEQPKRRNWLAMQAHMRKGGGHHGDRKKQHSKKCCRGRVRTIED